MTALTIDNLTVRIPLADGRVVHAASEVHLAVPAGTVTALVGESGCGKSILASAIMNMLPVESSVSGSVVVQTPERIVDVFADSSFRGRDVALIPQSASDAGAHGEISTGRDHSSSPIPTQLRRVGAVGRSGSA